MLRSFLPVGQGAFYRETFNFEDGIHTVIYDCGSSTNRSIVEEQIRIEFSKGETIDAVFVSHLDEDHINGLPFLLKYCKVKKLFFPLVTTRDEVYLKLKALFTSGKNGFLYNFLENPYTAFKSMDLNNMPNLYQVRAQEDNFSNNNDAANILSGVNVSNILNFNNAEEKNWEFIPFNFRQKSRIEKLKKSIVEIFGCETNEVEEKIKELINEYPKNKDKIKEAYRAAGAFNTNSMTLFSGIREHGISQFYKPLKCVCSCECSLFERENGCLYLGDYDASGVYKWNNLKNAYRNYWEYIGCIQIPHHGSVHNYNEEIAELNAINVISAGRKNTYHHPHASVIKKLVINDCIVHIVTENDKKRLDLCVDYL